MTYLPTLYLNLVPLLQNATRAKIEEERLPRLFDEVKSDSDPENNDDDSNFGDHLEVIHAGPNSEQNFLEDNLSQLVILCNDSISAQSWYSHNSNHD